LAPYREAVETRMADLLSAPSSRLGPLYAMIHYHLGWVDQTLQPTRASSGKRIRPILCLLVCEATGTAYESALPVAVAIEVLHNFSLVHDDIEDQDTERHKRPTLWFLWGTAQGINTGDAMFALSRVALHALFDQDDVSPAQALACMRRFDETTLALCQGQYLDISFETQLDVDVESYLEMTRGKTAALLAYATESGARLGDVSAEVTEAYRQFGEALGMAFQMIDDQLGVWGNTKITGKPVGADVRRRKKSLPVVYAMSALSGSAREELLNFYTPGKPMSQQDVLRVTELLEQSGAYEFVRDLAGEWQDQAIAALERAHPTGPAADLLHDLTIALLRRRY